MVSSKGLMLGLLLALPAAPALAAEEEAPPMELLEFLGSFESADGKWIDPTDFEIPLTDPLLADNGGEKDE